MRTTAYSASEFFSRAQLLSSGWNALPFDSPDGDNNSSDIERTTTAKRRARTAFLLESVLCGRDTWGLKVPNMLLEVLKQDSLPFTEPRAPVTFGPRVRDSSD